jgi:uncharacterized protein YaiI (UPF0178 family)
MFTARTPYSLPINQEKENPLKIWIDADACPRVVKEIVYRASERREIPVCLVANRPVSVPRSPRITFVRVPQGANEADRHIADHTDQGDIVITADIPLAAELAEKGALAIDPRGTVYEEDVVRERLSMRDFMEEMRGAGLAQGGPPQISPADRKRFADALDRELAKR